MTSSYSGWSITKGLNNCSNDQWSAWVNSLGIDDPFMINNCQSRCYDEKMNLYSYLLISFICSGFRMKEEKTFTCLNITNLPIQLLPSWRDFVPHNRYENDIANKYDDSYWDSYCNWADSLRPGYSSFLRHHHLKVDCYLVIICSII